MDPKLPDVNLANTLHEPPSDLDPWLVETLVSHNLKPTTNSLAATVLSLVQKKVIEIKTEKKESIFNLQKYEHWLTLSKNTNFYDERLSKSEKVFLRFFFQTAHTKLLSYTAMKEIINKDKTRAMNFWNNWKKQAVDELVNLGYLKEKPYQASRILALIGSNITIFSITAMYLTVYLTNYFYIIATISWIITGIAAVFFAPHIQKFTNF